MKQKKEELVRIPIPVEEADEEYGLSTLQVRQRQEGGWANVMTQGAGKTEREIVFGHIFTFFNMVFVALAILLMVAGSTILNMGFMIIVVVNTVIGIYQEIRAKRAVDKLTLVAEGCIRAMRDGDLIQIPIHDLVRDDIVEFRAGDQICADGIVRSGQLQVNESLITGEADAIQKELGDELMSGSFVISGKARVQLTQVGADSFAAQLAAEAKANPRAKRSGMQKSLDGLIRFIGFILIPVGVAMFYQHFKVLELGMRDSAEGTVAALIGMIPEGLYLLTSVALAVSALKLSKQRVLVKDMNCIETLARVDVLCVDKTGTITEPKMEVENVVPLSDDDPEYLENILSAFYDGQDADNDTARAMQEMFSRRVGIKSTRRIPFASDTKWSAAEFKKYGTILIGAPEFIMGGRFHEIREQVNEWSGLGYRVLLVAQYDDFPEERRLVERKLTPLALVLLTNRIRPEAPETFAYFKEQGVAIKVISGDNPATVADVARRAGIPGAERYIDTTKLESDKDFLNAVEDYTVFGRVTPEKKKKLIKALKKRKHTVAMTGDGVNDVLAMKEADCGIAMASGAQAASQVAQLVLLDSNFAAMPGIVAEGRRVINNIQRSAALFLVKNIFSFFLSIITIFTSLPYPLIPLHLTVISTTTIGIPSFFLAMEPNYERVSGRFLVGAFRRAFPGGLVNIFVVSMALAFMTLFGLNAEEASTICTAILSVVGLLVLFQISKPMGTFRKIIWGSMAAMLLVIFLFFRSFFSLHIVSPQAILVLTTLLLMTPTVFFAVQRVFDWFDRMILKLRGKFAKSE